MQLLHADTYLSMIQGSVGSNAYRHAYALVDGVKSDLTHDGEHSCAFFAASILLRFGLIQEPHLRVQGTIKDLLASGWTETSTPAIGDVLIWDAKTDEDGSEHLHIGFYLGDNQAISNRPSEHSPQLHHWTFGTNDDGSAKRKVINLFTHPTFFTDASFR